MLLINQKAPKFTTVNQDNKIINLFDYVGEKNIVLYFYPKDDTPGCTIEANQFTSFKSDFDKLNTVVFGVSKDDCESHLNFINKFQLKIELLADLDGSLCDDYGVWQEKEKNGVKKMSIVRSTFIITKEGILTYVNYGVAAEGHAEEILNILQ